MKLMAFLFLLCLGCTDRQGNTIVSGTGAKVWNLPDGRHVVCVSAYRGGLSCDWSNAK